MIRFIYTIILFSSIAILGACEVNLGVNNRSGSLEDDYVAEPLSDMSQKHENALRISNKFIEKMRAGELDSIYEQLFAESLRKLITQQDFKNLINQIHQAKGKIVKYKKMQWGFISGQENGENFLASTKIVEHNKGMMKYLIVFRNDGKYNEIIGFRYKERDGVSPPEQF